VTIPEQKTSVRTRIRAVLQALTPAQREAESAAACARLLAQPAWQRARSVLLFAPRPDELDLWSCAEAALAAGKVVCLPRSAPEREEYHAARVRHLQSDVVRGRFGIREPAARCETLALKRLDLILVPGLAFTQSGRRLGRGKGFYDRWLAGPCGRTCGVAFNEQLLDALPVELHDLTVDCILTPSRWIEVSPRRTVPD
jgi:5-formyltetrahydrofolate cyclo-ligase